MKYYELERKLKKFGCYEISSKGAHPIWFSPITGRKFTLSHHGSEEVKIGTLKSIIKDSGININL